MRNLNRRSFFKTVTGFVAGVYVACVPGTKPKCPAPKSKAKDWDIIIAPYNGNVNIEDIELIRYL